MRRQYFHYEQWEEFKHGMWRIVSGEERKANAAAAAALMRDIERFKRAMYTAVLEWRISCLQNLTASSVNRIAWLGHAGCCIGVGSPEENTRIGWHQLNQEEQDRANAAAAEVLAHWEATCGA